MSKEKIKKYRILRKGEIIKKGDEMYKQNKELVKIGFFDEPIDAALDWEKANATFIGTKVGERKGSLTGIPFKFRRAV